MKYVRNSNVFERIDTEEKAYWLGFLYADGYINQDTGEITIGLGEKDKEHIVKFQQFLQTDAPFKDKINNGGHPYRYFRIYDKIMSQDLYKQGLYSKKSLSLKPSFIMEPKFYVAWTRGLFDGDGSIFPVKNSKKSIRYRIDLIGTQPILKKVQEIWQIERKLDYSRSVPKFVICSKTQVNQILHLLYDDAKIYLDRKKNLAEEAIQINLL